MILNETTLGEVSSGIQTGPFGSQLHQSDYSEIGTPVVMPKDLLNGKICEDSIARVSLDHVNRLVRHKIEAGDILYSRRGDVGRCAYATETETDWLCGTGCLRVTIDPQKADSKYVFYRLQMPETIGWVVNHAVGSTMLNLNTSILSDVPLKLPALEEQKTVVKILSAYDDLIENNKKQIKLLEEAAQRLYKEWFVDLRFPGYESTLIADGVPQGWDEYAISDLCEKINAGGTPSRRNENYWNDATIKWYKTQELQDCWLIDSDERISDEGQKNSSAKFFPKNTILMAIYASPTLGRLGVLDSEATCNQAALCLKADEAIISWQWLYEKLYELRDHYNGIARGAGQQNISGEVVKQTIVLCPTKEIMDKFTQIVAPWFEKRRVLQKQNISLIETRDRLLPKLMSGVLEDKQ